MTSKTHVALGLLTGLIILNNNQHLDTYTVMSGVAIGSLIPDLDTKKSDPSQIFPPIAFVVDKLTKHRGFTHTMLPLLLIIAYYYFDNKVCLYMGIGGVTHLVIDLATYALGIKCDSGGESTIFSLLWILIVGIIVNKVWNQYHLIQYVPKEVLQNVAELRMKL